MEEQGKGFITVNVRTAGGALPVEGASVTVSTSDGINSPVCSYYTIDTGRAGFCSVVNTNVPVFDGVTSVQQVFLVPLAGGAPMPPSELTRFNDAGSDNGL